MSACLFTEESQKDPVTQQIAFTYKETLQHFILERFPSEANRFGDLMVLLSEIQAASYQLLHNKMIYIPFLLNSWVCERWLCVLVNFFFFFFFLCVPQLYLWGSPLFGEIFAYVTVF